MTPLVYYPGFEPADENWLKFALLYLERVTPIIPESADIWLSDDFRYASLFNRPPYAAAS